VSRLRSLREQRALSDAVLALLRPIELTAEFKMGLFCQLLLLVAYIDYTRNRPTRGGAVADGHQLL
jgi:hypothetical protein